MAKVAAKGGRGKAPVKAAPAKKGGRGIPAGAMRLKFSPDYGKGGRGSGAVPR